MNHILFYTLILLASFSWTQTGQNFVVDNGISTTQSGEKANQLIESIAINNKEAVFDASDNCYLQTIGESFIPQEDLKATVSFSFKSPEKGYQLQIDNKLPSKGQPFIFEHFSNGKIFTIKILDKNGSLVASSKLIFTFMPIVEITGSNFSRESYIHGRFRLTDANSDSPDSLMYAKFRYRGHYAMGKQKKAYNVKITDGKGKSADVSFFGLREDNSWILDAMAVDRGRMRNRVSTDLWNDFSTPPYFFKDEPKAINGTRGHFVELFLNQEYAGIYCMTEKIDRKQLKLKKFKKDDVQSVRGILYKADQWSYSLLMGHEPDNTSYPLRIANPFDNNKDVWDGWELKYPDVGDGEPIDWTPLFNAVNVPASYNDQTFSAKVKHFFDLPVMRDYFLFIELMLATDNHGKNLFLHCHDIQENPQLSITPWDLDGTWGRRWDGSSTYTENAHQDFIQFLWKYEHGENTLYKRLKELNVDQWNEKLANRYAELRKTYFSKESLSHRFHHYHDLFKISGAEQREIQRWNGVDGINLNFENEMQYIDNWISNRLNALDKKYGYTPTSTEQPSVLQKKLLIGGGLGKIFIQADHPVQIRVYSISGQLVGRFKSDGGRSEIAINYPGLYIVNGQKVVVW